MRIDLAPRHPARHTTESTAGLLARGSPPVTAFPGMSQWLCGSGSPLTVAGAAAESELWELCSRSLTAFPVRSHVRDRRSRSLNGARRRLVNADDAAMRAANAKCRAPGDLRR